MTTFQEKRTAVGQFHVGQRIRFFSMYGPCIPTVIKKVNRVTVDTNGFGKIEKYLCHTEPCPSCTDHERTQYPHGYMD